MRSFMNCVIYLAVTGILFFLIGRLLPRTWFRYDRFPYQSFSFERSGALYRILAVQKWKDRVPDMSRILPGIMPSRRVPETLTPEQAENMICETCIAEFTHDLLCVFAVKCIGMWEGIGGWLTFILYVLGNIPFNLIQRYNRPRLIRIAQSLKRKESRCLPQNKTEKTEEFA